MKRLLAIPAAALATAWSIGCVEVSGPIVDTPDWPFWDNDTTGQVRIEYEWRGQFGPGEQIEIKGVSGDIRAIPAPANEVVVTATKIGQPGDVANVDIEVVTHDLGTTICAVYPDVPGRQPNECEPGDAANMTTRDSIGGSVRVEFTVQVPEGVIFVARTLSGHVEAIGLKSDVFVHTLFGDARVSTTGLATARTMYGSIVASIGQPDWGRDLEFRTLTGDIAVTVPFNASADVHATAQFGHITSDFPLSQVSPGDMQGKIGAGEWKLTLVTLQGDIRLKRRL